MLNNDEPIDALVSGIKGTTDLLSRLISRKFGLILLFVAIGAIISKFVFG